ncbi:MAG: peptide chain release factor N(5)-glutamine methyltransferase [Alphaproteobacteria bacterium]|nr:peptide chain release factor N(5)-glutamine methyltransferase [Alphaproteobacteria bacterium]
MTLNQAFEILTKSADARAARMMTRHIAGAKDKLSLIQSIKIRIAARRLGRGVPVAKIIGRKWFYGLEFETGRATLDPRPDSETLVEAVLNYVGANENSPCCRSHCRANFQILDLGTGTGCLICAIVKNIQNATGTGVDISRGACRIARRNVKGLKLENKIKILNKDFNNIDHYPVLSLRDNPPLLQGEGEFRSNQVKTNSPSLAKGCPPKGGRGSGFDIIVSNPPYIAVGDARVDAGACFDPRVALYAGADGLDAYREISASARASLNAGGKIFLEIGAGQGDAVREIFESCGWHFVSSHNDLGGIERVLVFSSPLLKGENHLTSRRRV